MSKYDKYTKGPFVADLSGGYVFSSNNFMFAQVRGWGQLKYEKDAEATQNFNLQFMVDALNEKASGALAKVTEELQEAKKLETQVQDLKDELIRVLSAAQSYIVSSKVQ